MDNNQTPNYNQNPYGQDPNNFGSYNNDQQFQDGMETAVRNIAGTVLGIIGLISAIVLGASFGVIGAAISLIFSIIGIVLSIKAKKKSDNKAGGAGFVCSLIGIIIGVLFAAGCAIIGLTAFGSLGNYGCYGCLGGTIKLANDIEKHPDELQQFYEDLENNLDEDELQKLYENIEENLDEEDLQDLYDNLDSNDFDWEDYE